MPLRIDPNGAWSVEKSVQVGTALAGALEYLEDPAPGLAEMAEVRPPGLLAADIETPLASNNAMTTWADIPPALRLPAVSGDPERPPLLGWPAGGHPTWTVLRNIRHWPQHALEQSPWPLAAGDGSSRRRDAAPHVRQRHPLPVATTRRMRSWPVVACRFETARYLFPPPRPWRENSTRMRLARGKERYRMCGYRSRDDDAGDVPPRGSQLEPTGSALVNCARFS